MKNVSTLKKRQLSYEVKKRYYGYGFIALWLVGTIFFFIRPLVSVIQFSFSDILLNDYGYSLESVGFAEFDKAIRGDPNFLQKLSASLTKMLYEVPVIVLFSLGVGVVLNNKFRGRTVFRAIFFMPVIVSSGLVISKLNGGAGEEALLQSQSNAMFSVSGLDVFLGEMGLPVEIVSFLTDTANNIFSLSWRSGVQILLFIAALQSVSPALYEASKVEGASAWDNFWKLTLPSISPMILLAVIYTVVDSFIDYGNVLMQYITTQAKSNLEYSSAMVLLYSLVMLAIVGVIFWLSRYVVFYTDDNS